MKNFVPAILILVATSTAQAKPPPIPLECGNTYGAAAHRTYLSAASGGGDIYSINVTFTKRRPAKSQVAAALRRCIAEAIEKDATKDIIASGWFKTQRGADDNDDEHINPFGALKFISYTASTKTIRVREIELKRKG